MAYRMNGIPQLGGEEDAKKKLNTPYDSLKAGVGRYNKFYGEQDKPMKLDEARSRIKKEYPPIRSSEKRNHFILSNNLGGGRDGDGIGDLIMNGYSWGIGKWAGRRDGFAVAEITNDDRDGFYWYGKRYSIPKKETRKPTPKMDKIPTKGIAKGKKVEAKVKNPPKPKVKRTLYSTASQLAKQGKAVGYTETTLPGASRVLRQHIPASEYKKK